MGRRVNLEILMVVIIVLIVMILSSFTYVYIENLRGKDDIPDYQVHETAGIVTGYNGLWYKFAQVSFANGSEITFDGRGIWDAVSDLDLNEYYTFYWKWSTFDFETKEGKYVGKQCVRITDDSGNTIWTPEKPFVVHGLFFVFAFLIIIAPIVFMYWNDNRKKDKNG